MERIYLNYTGDKTKSGHVIINIFLKDVSSNHVKELQAFLRNQGINVKEMTPNSNKNYEFSYFDNGFKIAFAPHRWSFFQMRDYIYHYLKSWDEDTSFCYKYMENEKTGKTIEFDDHFYVELSKLVDKAEDKYYLGNRSISLFVNNILQILHNNLQLYWASVALKSTTTGKFSYTNFFPAASDSKKNH